MFACMRKKQYLCGEFPKNKERFLKSFLDFGITLLNHGKKRIIQITNRIESGRVAV